MNNTITLFNFIDILAKWFVCIKIFYYRDHIIVKIGYCILTPNFTYLKLLIETSLSYSRFLLIDTSDTRTLWSLIRQLPRWLIRTYSRALLIGRNRSFPPNLFYCKGESVIAFAFTPAEQFHFVRWWDDGNKISIARTFKCKICATSILRRLSRIE